MKCRNHKGLMQFHMQVSLQKGKISLAMENNLNNIEISFSLSMMVHLVRVLFFVLELMFLETSAMTGENVEESFLKCSRVILNRIENGKLPIFLQLIGI